VVTTVFLASAGALAVSTGLVYWVGLVALKSNKELALQREVIEHLERMASTLKDAETGQRGYLLTGEMRYLEPYVRALQEIKPEIAQLNVLAAQGELPSRQVSELGRLNDEKLAELAETVDLMREDNLPGALNLVRSNRGKEVMDAIHADLAGMEAAKVAQFQAASARIEQATRRRNLAFFTTTLFNLGLLFWAYSQIMRQVREREAAREQMRRGEQRYRSFVEASAQVVWRTNSQGEVDQPIPSWNRFTGQSDQEAAGFGWMKAIHPEDRPRVTEAWRVASAARQLYQVEYRLERHDGRWLHILARGVPVLESDGRVREYIGTCIDVTDQRQAEATLRESELRFRTLADSMPQLAWIAQPDGSIIWYNRRWYEYTGTTPEQMEGWGWQRAHDPHSLPAVLERWKASIATGQPFDMVFPLRGADGVFRPFLTRVMPLKDEQGRVIQWFGTNTDVTDQKRAEEALELRVEQRTAELVAANKELEAFGYSVSHDLRAPLRHVSSYISLLEKGTGPSLDDKSRRQVQIIAEAAKRMGGLIDDLLVLSRIGRASLAETNVDLRRLVDDARKELAPEMAGRTIEWRIGALPQVRADAALLRSAVVNLLSNAIKYSRRRDPARIELGSREHDGEVVLFVKDNGAGFDMRFADKLFGVFQRLHDRDEFEGTGIGLASVRRIIQRHGGRTWAEGAVEQGASFYFSLPIERVIQMKGAECGVRNQETSPGNQTKLEEVT